MNFFSLYSHESVRELVREIENVSESNLEISLANKRPAYEVIENMDKVSNYPFICVSHFNLLFLHSLVYSEE